MRVRNCALAALFTLIVLSVAVSAQTVVSSVNALRAGSFGTNVSVTLSNYYLGVTGGGGVLYSDSTVCQFGGNGNVSGSNLYVINVGGGFSSSWAKLALNMALMSSTWGFPANDTIAAFDPGAGTIKFEYPATSSGSGSFTLNGDNGGTAFVDAAGDCFHRVSSTYSQLEFGAYSDGSHNDTPFLQNWIDANQPHIAVPGNSIISGGLVCGYGGLTTQGVIQGPASEGVAESTTALPPFLITAAGGSGFTGTAMLTMEYGVQCGIHGVGLIADASMTNMYDTVDAQGTGDVIDGHSYLLGGYYNVKAGNPGPGPSAYNFGISDSSLNNSVSDNAVINSPNVKIVRNSFAGAGHGAGAGTSGNNITFTNTDIVIADNIIQQAKGWGIAAQSARQMRILGNYFDNNGNGDVNTFAIDVKNSGLLAITGNTFHRSGGATEGVATTSHVYFEGTDDSIALANNVYLPGVTGDAQIAIRPDYNYDADPAAILTNVTIADNPAPQAAGVFSPNAQMLIASAASPHLARNYLTGLALSNGASSLKVNIAAGEATDSTGTTVLQKAGCTVDLSQGGANGLDTGAGTEAPGTTYYIYLIAGAGGANPSCMASASLTPTFLNTGITYTLPQSGNTTAGSPIIFNVGGPFPDGAAPNLTFNPVAGMSANDPVSDIAGVIPSGAAVSTLTPFYVALTGDATMGTNLITNLTSVTGIAPNMVVGNPGNAGANAIQQGTIVSQVCSPTTCLLTGTLPCTPAPCAVLSQTVTANLSTSDITPNVGFGGNYTITMTNNANSTGADVSFKVHHGLYRILGAVMTDASGSNIVAFTQDNDTFYLQAPVRFTVDISGDGPSNISLPSLPGGVSVRAFGRCVGGGAAGSIHALIYSPLQTTMPPNAHPFTTVPGYAVDSLTPNTAFPFSAWTDTTGSLRAVSDGAATMQCMLDGWEWKRSP